MRKNGFTLIELLAVIVILAIIALIATPIILGIINNAREESNERSVELYASAVRNGMAAYQLREGKEVEAGTYNSSKLDFVDYEGNVDCTKVEIYEDGSFYLEGCKVNNGEKTYSYGTKQEKIMYINDVCNPLSVATPGAYTVGDKYECDVDPNKKGYDQMFYVLNFDATSVNLIMDSNIRANGEAVKEENPSTEQIGTVAWINKSDCTSEEIGGSQTDCDNNNMTKYGPITAMNYLAEATKNWKNVNTQTISTFYSCPMDQETCTEQQMPITYIVNARLPHKSELDIYVGGNSPWPLFLLHYLDGEYDSSYGITGRNGVYGLYGYWTDSSFGNNDPYLAERAWNYYSGGGTSGNYEAYANSLVGVRPVINLSI